jgi:hypothetical protein
MPLHSSPPAASPFDPNLRYEWERFWVAQTDVLDLSDAGFLSDPTARLLDPSSATTLAELRRGPALALLGEPGIGKSTSLKLEADRIAALPPEANAVSIYVNLNANSNEDALCRRIFGTPAFAAWKDGTGRWKGPPKRPAPARGRHCSRWAASRADNPRRVARGLRQ